MDSPDFRVVEHTIPCSYIREYPNSTRNQRDDVPLRLAIKQYLPTTPVPPDDPNAVTIIAAHATGVHKEAYEPLWDDLHAALRPNRVKIRGIWIADMSNHGASGVLNEHVQGDDPGWFDLSRDLLHMVNVFRDEIKRPIIGVAHSMGASIVANLSLMHPRLFAGLVFIEPMIQQDVPPGKVFAGAPSVKQDLWQSRQEAEAALRKNRFTASLDPRVLKRLDKHGLRSVPTLVYPLGGEVKPGAVTLTTTKHQEAWTYLRPNFAPSTLTASGDVSARDRLLAPDVDHATSGQYLFFRPEFGYVFSQLPHLRPRMLYVFGDKSPMSTPELQAAKVDSTGMGCGGGGGVRGGQVEVHRFPELGHMLPLERVGETAEVVVGWIGRELKRWKEDEAFLRAHGSQKSAKGGLVVSEKWIEMTRNKGTAKRPRVDEAEVKMKTKL